jgi:DNA mismatch repair protein MutL
MKIKILSNTTINRIAAGEVVERPSSAIKELVENAIDAQATKIDIIIENAGQNLITIIDNGIGMSKEDLNIAVERHSTSKLFEEDINQIEFFGFRGEALPSIASVSRMTLTSKSADTEEDCAWSLTINAGEKQNIIPSTLSKGTKIEVRDLFFATPARLKFLKSEKTEVSYITDILQKIAMANPNIAFSLTSNNKEIFNLKAYQGDDALYNRLNDIIGKNFKDNFTYVNIVEQDLKIYGYISLPTHNIGTTSEQYFFVNKRPINNKLLSIASKIAYQDFIPHGRYPLFCLFLELESAFVDVNVHPCKSEVRFKDNILVRNLLSNTIKQGIRQIGHKVSTYITDVAIQEFKAEIKLESSDEPLDNIIKEKASNSYLAPSKSNINRSFSNYKHPYNQQSSIFTPIAPMVKADNSDIDLKQSSFPLGAACGQIHNTYIIAQTDDAMLLVDQHAAHERIFYEKLKQQITNKKIQTQRLLVPEIIDNIAPHILESLLSEQNNLNEWGLVFETFGSDAISITQLPALLNCSDVKKLFLDIMDDIVEHGQSNNLESKINKLLATYACHHSIRAGRNLSIVEMNALLREMEKYEHIGQCNHGRPTYIKLYLKDIEKLFERT